MATIATESRALPHGITLACRSAGDRGRPLLVFLHGFPEAAFVWDDVLLHFSQAENGGFRCIAPNLRGYAPSSAPPEVSAYRAKHLVQDIAALIDSEGGPAECVVAHDWGGAVAWGFAAAMPQRLKKLAIVNAPHAATFLRELQHSPGQQAASAYMNFLVRPDAEALLAEDDYRRLWALFTGMGASEGPHAWLIDELRARYREVWAKGLTGPCNYYRASPLRPSTPDTPTGDGGVAAVSMPREMLEVKVPTMVVWGLGDTALRPELLDGLEAFVPDLRVHRVEGATHWILHEQPARVVRHLQDFLAER